MPIKVTIDQAVSDRLPGFRLGIIEYGDVAVSETPKMAKGRIHLFAANLRLDYSKDEFTQIVGIKEWRQGFKALGIDPSKYRPSSEALLRRVFLEKPMLWVNGAVDTNNLLSMSFALPYGIYNADQIQGTIECRLGKTAEAYEALNGRETSMEGKLLLGDQAGAFGSPIVDSVRTSIDETAHHLIQLVFIHPQFAEEKLEELLEASSSLFVQINGGNVLDKRWI